MVSTNEAASLTGTNARSIFRGVEAGELHFLESETGELMVCSESLRGE